MQLTIARLPPILLIHLKRFYFQGPFRNKVDTYVDFAVRGLNMSRYVPSKLLPSGERENFVYDLYALSVSKK